MQTNSHLSRLIHDQAKKYGDREVLIYKDFGGSEWKSYSWNQFSDMVKRVSNFRTKAFSPPIICIMPFTSWGT